MEVIGLDVGVYLSDELILKPEVWQKISWATPKDCTDWSQGKILTRLSSW